MGRPFWTRPLTANRAREAAKRPGVHPPQDGTGRGRLCPTSCGTATRANPELTGSLHRRGRLRRLGSATQGRTAASRPSSPVGQDAQRGKGPGGQGVRQR